MSTLLLFYWNSIFSVLLIPIKYILSGMRWVTEILLREFILEKPENLLENSWKSPGILNLYLAGHPV